ncbi:MAG: 4Fe-4S ferredoxin [Planctomycetes bacterium]|nr:4Fe-4S ferredoxin [Planctomycetota bacterium]
MAKRNIVKIDENKCNGCGLCVNACAEGAIQLVNGKARLVSEIYCDGLGACLGHCPQGAITIEQRDAAEFDEKATHAHLKQMKAKTEPAAEGGFGCPGMRMRTFEKKPSAATSSSGPVESQLGQWPVQLKLVSPMAPYFAGSDLLLAADCVPFAMGDFHSTLLKDHSVAVGCPKLDDGGYYVDKLTQIIQHNHLHSLTVVHMEVPCCSGLLRIAEAAIQKAGVKMDYEDITISLQGRILSRKTIAR